ncbi:nuclear transport factor 2 family protein [Kribbella sp. NPDC056951]|uniref:nuclear transport factor 2 family protein n=1 Tax=Kribbella sp. NPDC056951 TaxID=3345978 RepID=UPI003634EE97
MTPEEVFRKLVSGVAAGQYAELPDLYAEQTDVRHPMSPYGAPPLLSREALREHFTGTGPQVAATVHFEAADIVVHQTADPEVIVGEFAYAGVAPATGERFRVPCVFVLRVRDGEIVESRDYVDHVAMAKARGRLEELIAALREPVAADGAS